MKFANWKIGHRLGAGFGLVIFAMLAITTLGTFHLYRSTLSIEKLVGQRFPHSILVNTIKADFTEAQGSISKILIDGSPQNARDQLMLVKQSVQFVSESMGKLDHATFLERGEKEHVAELRRIYDEFLQAANKFGDLVATGEIEEARAIGITDIESIGTTYLQRLDTLIRQHEELAAAEGKNASESMRQALLLMLILAAIGCLVGAAIGTLVTRTITRPLMEAVAVADQVAQGDLTVDINIRSGDETGMLMQSLHKMTESLAIIVDKVRHGTVNIEAASRDIGMGISSLSSRTEHQANALGQTASSITQLTSTVKQTSDNAELADTQVQAAAAIAKKGGAVVAQVVNTMELIKMSSQRIGDIIGVVDGIAFQTNILALNAAVEAARAGEQGRGFAVVAAEVRNLAQRSADASKEIKQLISESVSSVVAGSCLVEEAGTTMAEIVRSVECVAHLMSEITAASREQSEGIEVVNTSIHQMDDMTQQNAAMAEEATAASDELWTQASELAKAVSAFKVRTGDQAIAVNNSEVSSDSAINALTLERSFSSSVSDYAQNSLKPELDNPSLKLRHTTLT